VEEVVAGDAEAVRIGVLGAKRHVEQPRVAGVDVGLGRVGRGSPAVELGLGRLHRQIGSLDEAHLDGAARAMMTLQGPGNQVREHAVGLGQVRLQDDSRANGVELGLTEHELECGDGQLEVAILLHVEIDKGPVRLGLAIEQSHPGSDPSGRTMPVDGNDLADERRELHRHVVDLGSSDHREYLAKAFIRFSFAEHRLAQDIDVQRDRFTTTPIQVAAKGRRLGGQDQVLREMSDPPMEGRDHEAQRRSAGRIP
jgi:hypothetical protein